MTTSKQVGTAVMGSKNFSNALMENASADARNDLLLNESLQDRAALKSITGCVSSISSCAAIDHGYTDALKNYAEVYEKFQAYLSPLDTLSEHDYDRVIAMSVPQNSHLGCLNDDMVEFISIADTVSDDDIESCGYLGWLNH